MDEANETKATMSHLAGERTVAFGASFVLLSLPLGGGAVWLISHAFAEHARMAGGLFLGVISLVLTMVGVSTIRSGLWYGRATLSLRALPAVAGDVIEGHVTIARGLTETTDVSLTFEQLRRESPYSRRSPQRERVVSVASVARLRDGVAVVPVRIDVPAHARPSTGPGERPLRSWHLHLEASPREGPALRTSFVVPVVPPQPTRP